MCARYTSESIEWTIDTITISLLGDVAMYIGSYNDDVKICAYLVLEKGVFTLNSKNLSRR